jgi:glycosyltransferase involved in cell wall biosynthesis
MRRIEGGRRLRGQTVRGTVVNPLVTVITVVRNGVAHIEDAIRAVHAQTYPNIEHIVIDGGSTDGTVDILLKFDNWLGYWASDKDRGLYDAMNKGVRQVTDPDSYILFANADDTLYSADSIASAMSLSSGEDLVYGKMVFTDGKISGVQGRRVEFEDLARETLCHPATFVRKRVFDQIGPFDTSLTIAADYDHIVRAFAARVSTRFVDVIVSRMRMGGLSDDKFMLSCQERKIVVRRHFSLIPRLKGVWHVNLYDIPRNMTRRVLARAGLLGHWRTLKGSQAR